MASRDREHISPDNILANPRWRWGDFFGWLFVAVLLTGFTLGAFFVCATEYRRALSDGRSEGRCLELCRPEPVKTILEDECVCSQRRVRLKR